MPQCLAFEIVVNRLDGMQQDLDHGLQSQSLAQAQSAIAEIRNLHGSGAVVLNRGFQQ